MRAVIGRVAVAALVAASLGLVGAGKANAAGGDGPYAFGSSYRLIDTRNFSGPKLAAGQGVPIPSGFLNATITQADAPGTLGLGPCGGTPHTVVLAFEAGESPANRLWAPATSCLTPSVSTHLVVDQDGLTEAAPAPDGNRYFSLATAVTVLDTFASGTELAQLTTLSTAAAGLPAGATGVAVRLGLAGDPGFLTAYQCGAQHLWSDVNTAGAFAENIAYVRLDPSGNLCLYAFAAHAQGSVEVLGYFTDSLASGGKRPPTLVYHNVPAPGLTPITPTRVLDTRKGLGAAQGKLAGGQVLDLDLSQYIVPDTSAVVINLTATEAEGPGYLTAYPCHEAWPDASNVNFVAGANVPNLATVEVGTDGHVCIFAYAATHVVADLAGTFDFNGGDLYGAVAPARILDTRAGTGAPKRKLAAGQVLHLQVTGQGGVPAGATAATLNLTSTESAGPGYLTLYPCDAPQPDASNVNYVAGQSVPNLVTVKLAADGSVCIFAFATTHVIGDVAGYFGNGGDAGFFAVSPERVLDTRKDQGEPVQAGDTLVLDVTGGDPGGTKAVTLNLTVTQPEGPGYVTAYPCDEPRPNASNVNFVAGQDVANLVTVKLAHDGTVCLYAFAATHLIADVAGFMDAGGTWVPAFRVY